MPAKAPEPLQSLFPSRFTPFTQTKPRRRGRREDAGGRLSKTGILDLNVNGSELGAQVVRDSLATMGSCGILWALDLQSNEVAGAIVPADTQGVTPIRVDKKDRYTVYLTDLFEHYPQLRAYGGNKVKVSRPAGANILVVHLSVSLHTKTKPRTDSADTAQKKGTSGKKKAEAARKKGEAAVGSQVNEA